VEVKADLHNETNVVGGAGICKPCARFRPWCPADRRDNLFTDCHKHCRQL